MKKAVGRPIEKINRKKIGLSIDGHTDEILTKLTKMTGKTKSKIVEESLSFFYEKELDLERRLRELEEQSKDTSYKKLTELLNKSKR